MKIVDSNRRFLYDLLSDMKCVACRCVSHLKVVGLATPRKNLLLLAEIFFLPDRTGSSCRDKIAFYTAMEKKLKFFYSF